MIVTVTLNAAVDKTYTVEDFATHPERHRVYRPSAMISVAGGKGINVSRVLHTLGQPTVATGFAGGYNGGFITSSLDREGIVNDFLRTRDESRICITVVDPATGITTDLNENGPEISPEEAEAMLSKIESLISGASYLILSGSAPPSAPDDLYARAIRLAKKVGVRCVLDSSGEPLRLGLQAKPYMVKPNIGELSEWAGSKLETADEVLKAAKTLARTGIQVVLASMGSQGAIVTDGDRAWRAAPPEINFVSAVGCGDALVAAFVDALLRGEDLPKSLRAGTAAAAANAEIYGAGLCTAQSINALRPKVMVEEC